MKPSFAKIIYNIKVLLVHVYLGPEESTITFLTCSAHDRNEPT